MSQIALLFLTRKDLNHSQIWKQLLEDVSDLFNVYIHCKELPDDPFFRKYVIQDRVETSYYQHVKAWQVLLRTAFQNKNNIKFVYLSESCMPLYPLTKIYDLLIKDNFSYMNWQKPWWDENIPGAYGKERTLTEIDSSLRVGNDEWVILNRDHAEMIINDDYVINIAAKHTQDIESYPSTLFSIKNRLHEFVKIRPTFADWERTAWAHTLDFRNIHELPLGRWKEIREKGHFFIRKIPPSFQSEDLRSLIFSDIK